MLPAGLSATICCCAQAGNALEGAEAWREDGEDAEREKALLAVRVGSVLGVVGVLSTPQLALRCPDWQNVVSICLQGDSAGCWMQWLHTQQLCTGLIL